MENLQNKELLESLKAGFIEKNYVASSSLMPSLLVNDKEKEKKILTEIDKELVKCCSFDFSVAFITPDGLASILLQLEELRKRGVKGKILTTNYLNFTHPASLSKILQFDNIELKVYTKGGFHPKGYIFDQGDYYSIIIGSANLTSAALSKNQEWSLKFVSYRDGNIVDEVKNEFDRVWEDAELVTDEWIDNYSKNWKNNVSSMRKAARESDYDDFRDAVAEGCFDENEEEEIKKTDEILPNTMQTEALESLKNLREEGKDKALLIAATGTGKTYLSIFDVAQVKPKRVLFVAHRDMILKKSADSFAKFIKEIDRDKDIGFLNGVQKDKKSKYLFASIFTLAKDEILYGFPPDSFDYIIVDEVHHAGAASYEKIIKYFTPKFLLGLTATPERSDGYDIYKLFNNNVAYEIHLQDALEADLLCPFHYYGITDLTIDNEKIDEKSEFAKLIADERIEHIERALTLYKTNESPVKGLIFCSRVEEAEALSEKLNERGFITTYLTGNNSDQEREKTVERLEDDNDPLQYIITVDIFNEGVDIPSINQIVMLRPTQSAIIFVQQFGRGLRKAKNKDYVSVIDFIGNYANNFFIPIALYGDRTFDKDHIRKAVIGGSASIPGSSTVQISEISKKEIFEALDKIKFSTKAFLKGEYEKLKMRLARIPTMMDFVNNQYIDPMLFITYNSSTDIKHSYYEFKLTIGEEIPHISEDCRLSLKFISVEFAHGIRPHELLLLYLLMNNEELYYCDFANALEKYGVKLKKSDFKGVLNTLSLNFYVEIDKKGYKKVSYLDYDKDTQKITRSTHFDNLLKEEYYRKELEDVLEYGLKRATLKDKEKYEQDNFVLYRKYSRKDVCKLINWKLDEKGTIYGYKSFLMEDSYVCPIFVTYNKDENIAEGIKYADEFIDVNHFSWMTRHNKNEDSPDVAPILNQKKNNLKVKLFVKKNDNEGSDFYYLGNMDFVNYKKTTKKTDKGMAPILNIEFKMEKAIPESIYTYLEA